MSAGTEHMINAYALERVTWAPLAAGKEIVCSESKFYGVDIFFYISYDMLHSLDQEKLL